MIKSSPTIISVGYGRHIFSTDNVERNRLKICAHQTAGLHMIIFTLKSDGLEKQIASDKLIIYPTNSATKITMIFDAFKIASKLVRSYKSLPKNNLLVTTQDPFEAGLVGFFLKLIYGTKLIIQEHSDAFSATYWRNESAMNFIRYYYGLGLLRFADIVRVVSERTKENLTARGIKKINKLPVAINIDKFKNLNLKLNNEKLFTPDTFVFLTVARFVPQKNFTLMLEAFFLAYDVNPKIRLHIVGKGPEANSINQYIKTKSVERGINTPILVADWSNDVAGLMKKADAYLLTSNYEGWARVLIEALVSRLPVVTTDVGCAGEVIKNNIHGLVVPVNKKGDLVKAMIKISTDTNLYTQIKTNLAQLNHEEIVGTKIDSYGKEWVKTME